jgi:hypothetical protein
MQEEIPDVISKRLVHADKQLKRFADALGKNFDYSLESLSLLEYVLKEAWPEPPKDSAKLDGLVQLYGAYFGEAVRRIYGGRWVTGDGLPILQGPHPDCKLSPFTVIFQKLAHRKPIEPWVAAYGVASKPDWKPH